MGLLQEVGSAQSACARVWQAQPHSPPALWEAARGTEAATAPERWPSGNRSLHLIMLHAGIGGNLSPTLPEEVILKRLPKKMAPS